MKTPSTAKKPDQPGTGEWESEGGSLKPGAADPLPLGITAETLVQYRVGHFTYARLEDALAEHARQARK